MQKPKGIHFVFVSNVGNNFERIKMSVVGLIVMIKVINKFKNNKIYLHYFLKIYFYFFFYFSSYLSLLLTKLKQHNFKCKCVSQVVS